MASEQPWLLQAAGGRHQDEARGSQIGLSTLGLLRALGLGQGWECFFFGGGGEGAGFEDSEIQVLGL